MSSHEKLEDEMRRLRRLLEPWFSADTAVPGTDWGEGPISCGHCAAVSLIVQASVGGELQSTTVNGVSHWFNRVREHDDWLDVDLTGDQFGFAKVQLRPRGTLYPAAQTRTSADVAAETTQRALTLARRAGLDAVCEILTKGATTR